MAERLAFAFIAPAVPMMAVVPVTVAIGKADVAGVEAEIEALRRRRSRAADHAHRQGGREHRRCCEFLHKWYSFRTVAYPTCRAVIEAPEETAPRREPV